MLSDEEKKAINNMKVFARVHQDMTVVTANEIDIVLNLIEKQQKEIEEAKQKEKKAYIDGTNVAHELCNKRWKYKIKAKIKELEKLNDEATGIGYGFAIYYLQSLLQEGENNEC